MVIQLCTFQVDGSHFGIDVQHVQEVIRHQPMTPVPLAPGVVRGLVNLRGQIVAAVDLRLRLGHPAKVGGAPPMHVVVRRDEGAVSLLVDEIGDVIDAPDHLIEPTPHNLRSAARPLVRGVCKLNNQLLLILDVDRTVDVAGLA